MKAWLFLTLISSPLWAANVLLDNLRDNPSEATLTEFKKNCVTKNWLHFDGDDDAKFMEKTISTGNIFMVRGLVFSEDRCSEGASQLSARGNLGNSILLKYPEVLIQALFDEKREDMYHIVEAEGVRWFKVTCKDKKCRLDRKKDFAKKRVALTKAKISKELEPVRRKLLSHLKSDQN